MYEKRDCNPSGIVNDLTDTWWQEWDKTDMTIGDIRYDGKDMKTLSYQEVKLKT